MEPRRLRPRPSDTWGCSVQADWTFSGRSETSRRTITAGVNRSGYDKMVGNWIYKAPGLKL